METAIKIINFQIKPYSDTIAEYINSLNEEEIYNIFNKDMSADIFTAALYAIYKLESNARNIILQEENINKSSILREANRVCPDSYKNLDIRILNSLADVYLRDNLLFSDNINELGVYPNVLVLVINGLYAGHVYAWNISSKGEHGTEGNIYQVINVIGIRTSLFQLLIDQCELRQKSITSIFFDAIHKWAISKGSNYIRALQPIGPLPNLLTRCGFIMTKSLRNDEKYKWLFDNNSIGDTSLGRMLVFREYDYIINVSDSAREDKGELQCKAPYYNYKQI